MAPQASQLDGDTCVNVAILSAGGWSKPKLDEEINDCSTNDVQVAQA